MTKSTKATKPATETIDEKVLDSITGGAIYLDFGDFPGEATATDDKTDSSANITKTSRGS